ncbi:MAG: WecB/TagA/CpsF family glycosyltransferase [Anaerolineaceae bacterium]|nr:MAG: WecB/TagA/CpsF family glycosyltransferase [Anaerolineaceae bacterium]
MTESTQGIAPEAITILNTPVHSVSMIQTLHLVHRYMTEPGLHQIATTNPEFVMRAQHDEHFRQVLQEADLCIADGVGLILAAHWLGTPLPERVPGSELVYKLAEMAAQEKWRIFLLGAGPGVADKAAAIFQSMYPQLKIAGTYAGSPDPSENELIAQLIKNSRADILFVAYGAPNQDKWIARNRETLPTVRLAIGVGGSLDFVTGKTTRAPSWIQNLGLEWLYRLLQEPWRWRRMLALPHFAIKVLLTPRS